MKASSWPGATTPAHRQADLKPLATFPSQGGFLPRMPETPRLRRGRIGAFNVRKSHDKRRAVGPLSGVQKKRICRNVQQVPFKIQFLSPPISHHRASDGVDDVDGNGRRNSTHDSRMGDSKLVAGSIDIRTRDYSSRGCNSRTRNTQVHYRK